MYLHLGMNESQAFRSFFKALKNVKPVETVRILPGNYYESIGIENCGNSIAAFTIEGNNGTAVLYGDNEKAICICPLMNSVDTIVWCDVLRVYFQISGVDKGVGCGY